MIPHAATLISKADITLFHNIRTAVESLPDNLDLGKDPSKQKVVLSCHILVRAVVASMPRHPLALCDGRFLRVFEHSWIMTPSGNIIDVYPVGMIGGPLLIDGSASLLASQLYTVSAKEDADIRYRKMFESAWFKEAVRHVTCFLQGLNY
jgi:hypothetical protein